MDSKRTTQQLKEALEYSENVVSTMRESLLVLDTNLRIISATGHFTRCFLLRLKRLRGNSFTKWIKGNGIFLNCENYWNIYYLKTLVLITTKLTMSLQILGEE